MAHRASRTHYSAMPIWTSMRYAWIDSKILFFIRIQLLVPFISHASSREIATTPMVSEIWWGEGGTSGQAKHVTAVLRWTNGQIQEVSTLQEIVP